MSRNNASTTNNGANLGYEAELFRAGNKLRNRSASIDSIGVKHWDRIATDAGSVLGAHLSTSSAGPSDTRPAQSKSCP